MGRRTRASSPGAGSAIAGLSPEADRTWVACGDVKYARLVALKDRCDPANLFRLNQNIRPGRPAAEQALGVLA